MENLAVITFHNIQDATGGLNKLKELDEHNDIILYNILLVRKNGESQYELLYHY